MIIVTSTCSSLQAFIDFKQKKNMKYRTTDKGSLHENDNHR